MKCPTLRGPDHGTLSLRLRATSGFLEARFRCAAGYRLDGSSWSVCVDGLWSDSVPICIPAEGKRILLAAYSLHHSSEWIIIGKTQYFILQVQSTASHKRIGPHNINISYVFSSVVRCKYGEYG